MKFEVGKRYIAKGAWAGKSLWEELIEVRVLEVSPSGTLVKFAFPSDSESWEEVEDWTIVEEING